MSHERTQLSDKIRWKKQSWRTRLDYFCASTSGHIVIFGSPDINEVAGWSPDVSSRQTIKWTTARDYGRRWRTFDKASARLKQRTLRWHIYCHRVNEAGSLATAVCHRQRACDSHSQESGSPPSKCWMSCVASQRYGRRPHRRSIEFR